jgi:predicted metal-dependent hydrolase
MQYTLRHPPRSKRITLKVEPPSQVIVSAPKRTPKRVINKFVDQNSNWIQKQILKISQRQSLIESDSSIMIFGTLYQKIMTAEPNKSLGISISDQDILLNFPHVPEQNLTATREKELNLFLKRAARTFLGKQLKHLSQLMEVEYSSLTLREQKTRWGSCSGQDNISLNWRLVHYPPEIISYVIVHELAHLVHHNHSKDFWHLVAQYDPDYSEHRSYLKKHGITFS